MTLATVRDPRLAPAQGNTGLRLGVEQEFELYIGARRVDFRSLYPGIIAQQRSVRFRASQHAAILEAGYMLACDGRMAEFATAPVGYAGRGALALGREVVRCRSHMLGILRGAGIPIVRGYSTHLSISVPDGREREIAEALSETVGPALILLLESHKSPGLLLRTRRGRLELGSEYVDDEQQLTAAIVFLAGVVEAYLDGEGAWQLFPRVRLKHWEEANIRPGLYLPHNAYGESIHRLGRAARLEGEDGGNLTAGELLARCTDAVNDRLHDSVGAEALGKLSAFAQAGKELAIETHIDPARVTQRLLVSPAAEARTLQILGGEDGRLLRLRFLDWEGGAFATSDDPRPLFLSVPWAQLPEYLEAVRHDNTMSLVPPGLSSEKSLNSLDQLRKIHTFQNLDAPALGSQAIGKKTGATNVDRASPKRSWGGTNARRALIVGAVLLILAGLTAVWSFGGLGTPSYRVPPTAAVPEVLAPGAGAIPVLPQLIDTPTPVGHCLPSPSLTYPPAGAIRSTDVLLRWASTEPLQAGQMFAVLAARTPADLGGVNANKAVVGSTSETSLALSFAQWKYAGSLGSFYWLVRIQGTDGTFLDCGTGVPLTFSISGVVPPTKPAKQGADSGPAATACPPKVKCP